MYINLNYLLSPKLKIIACLHKNLSSSSLLLQVFLFGTFSGMEDHHMTGTPGIYSGRSTSSSSSPGVAGSSPALLVVPQPINATKMGGMQNGGPQPRKYQCKMCPQVSDYYCIFAPKNDIDRLKNCLSVEI